jgi:hypothetical protein
LDTQARCDVDVDVNENIARDEAMHIDTEGNVDTYTDICNIKLVDVPSWDVFSDGKGFDLNTDACYLKTYHFIESWQKKGIKANHALRFRKRPITPRLIGPQLPTSTEVMSEMQKYATLLYLHKPEHAEVNIYYEHPELKFISKRMNDAMDVDDDRDSNPCDTENDTEFDAGMLRRLRKIRQQLKNEWHDFIRTMQANVATALIYLQTGR